MGSLGDWIKMHGTENLAGLQFWEKNVFRLDLNESREGFCWRGRGRSFHVDGLKTEKAVDQQWRVWCEESGGWEYQKWSREYGRVCKVEDSHRDKTEQCPWYIYFKLSVKFWGHFGLCEKCALTIVWWVLGHWTKFLLLWLHDFGPYTQSRTRIPKLYAYSCFVHNKIYYCLNSSQFFPLNFDHRWWVTYLTF